LLSAFHSPKIINTSSRRLRKVSFVLIQPASLPHRLMQPPSLRISASYSLTSGHAMDFYELPGQVTVWLDAASNTFQRVPGSSVLIRYVRSSYQNDPVRSAIELILVIFFIRYLLSPSYSTSKQNFIKLSEDVSKTPIDDKPFF
jgi:hypothetical protein